MKKFIVHIILFIALSLLNCPAGFAQEMYILSTRDGYDIVVRDFKFTDEYVEYTTDQGLPGFIQKKDLEKISNMVGVESGGEAPETVEKIRKRELMIWAATAAALIALYLLFLFYVIRRKKGRLENTGRVEKKAKTQGHLAFRYKERIGRPRDWVIAAGSAYEKGGILFIEGTCLTTEKRKTFRADRVVGPVRDMSSDRQYRIESIFTDADQV
ncbi:MAG: hypothetical protein SCH71_01860 [Desulfobulbaceae bacterium]|nr:hypothetical protein [Desulfobulbaceae bacterium]